MKKVFFVRYKRDKMPYMLVTVRAGGTDFQPLSDDADDVADVFDSVYRNRPINKQELDSALDDDFTIEGPINPTRGNLNLLQDFLADVNQPLAPRKLAPSAKSFEISSVPLGFSDNNGKVNLTEYKARNFLYEQTKTTFNYEVKRVRALWDVNLSIPGTGRRGGWRCPVGTRFGGQITDRFGRNCGWGVARRIANAITNIGERMEGLDDNRRGRRVQRRNRRMLERLGQAEGGGRAERGLRNVAEALDGGEATPTPDAAPAPKAPRKPGRGAQARRRARNTTEALAEARDRGLRDSERRRVRREIDKPDEARTDERTKDNDLNEAEEAFLRKIKSNASNFEYAGFWDVDFDLNDDERKILKELIKKGYLKKPLVDYINQGLEMNANGQPIGERREWFPLTNKARRFLGVTDSRLMDSEEQVDKPKKPQAPRKRPRNARKPSKRPQGEARKDPTKPVGGPNGTEDYAGYVNRKYDEYAENVRKIRERGGRAGFLTRREWYDINKGNLDDAWRKKGKGEAPDDFMPPTPAKKRRRQPGARKKPPVQDKEPTPEKPEPKKIEEEFPNQEPTMARALKMLADKGWEREPAPNRIGNKWKKGNYEITIDEEENGDVFVMKDIVTGEMFQIGRGEFPLDKQLEDLEILFAERDPDVLNNKPKTPKKPKPKKPQKKKRAWTIDYGERRPRNRMQQDVGRGERRDIAGAKGLATLTNDELIAEFNRINDDEYMKDWDIRPVEREAIKKNIEEEMKYRVDNLPGADALNDVLPPRGGDKPDGRPAAEANEEDAIAKAEYDADARVDALNALFVGGELDTNRKAQLKRKYRDMQDIQEKANKMVSDKYDNLLAENKLNDAQKYVAEVEKESVDLIEEIKKQQTRLSLIAQNQNMADRVRQDALLSIAENAAQLDGARMRLRYIREKKQNIDNPALNFQNVPFKVYAADATEPFQFFRDADDRRNARADLRNMVSEAAQREIKKWEDGQRKKPKMMIMYHDGKAYVTEYEEFKKMTRQEQAEQIKKGIVVFNVNGGMSDNISRDVADGREALETLFDSDIAPAELNQKVNQLLEKYPKAKKLDAGANAERELAKIKEDMLKEFKDFPDFRVIELADENNEKVLIAIADDDFRNMKREDAKFGKNAKVLQRKGGQIAPSRPRDNLTPPVDADARDNNPIGNPFEAKIDSRINLGIDFKKKGIGKYKKIVNENIKSEGDAIKFVKDGGDLSKVPHEFWQAAVDANSSRDKIDKDKRFKVIAQNGGAIGDTRIYVLRDKDGYGTNQGLVFKASSVNDNVGELVGWNFMHQVGIIKGGAVGDGQNARGKQFVVLPFAFNDIPNGNELTDFGGGRGNYPITAINQNISNQYQPQMFAARFNQELLNFALGVHDRHRGNGVAKAVKLPNGDHMAHIVPIDLGWGGDGVQNDPLRGGGVDDKFWGDLTRALDRADGIQKQKIQNAIVTAYDNMIQKLNDALDGGEDVFVRDAVKNIKGAPGKAKAKLMYKVMSGQRAKLMAKRDGLIQKIGM